jgi:tetratricopeptide (TPR) repeat protein
VGALCGLGGALRRARQQRAAPATYREAEALAGEDARAVAPAHVGIAAVLRDLERPAESRRLYEQVLATNRNDHHAILGLAALYLDEVERTGSPTARAEAKRLLGILWQRDERTHEVHAVYGRLHSLSG